MTHKWLHFRVNYAFNSNVPFGKPIMAKKWLLYSRKQYSFDSSLIICQIRFPFHQHSCWSHPANIILMVLNDFLATEWSRRERITVWVCGRVCSIYFVYLKKTPEKVRIFSLCVLLLAKCQIRSCWQSNIVPDIFLELTPVPVRYEQMKPALI